MPDEKVYLEDPSLGSIETEVIERGETGGRSWVRLARTIFHPEGGGQPADRGTIGGVEVAGVEERGGAILHHVAGDVPLGPASARIDMGRRIDMSEQHTAQHLLTAILADRHSMPTTAFHLGETYSAIEVDGPVPGPERLVEYEDEVNALVVEDRPVRSRLVDPSEMASLRVRTRGLPEGLRGPVRLVEIEGVDLSACGGTHVDRLRRIRTVHLTRAEPARGGARIHYLAGGRVIGRLRSCAVVEADLKRRIGTGPEEFARVIDTWQAERKALGRRMSDLEAALADRIGADLASSPDRAIRCHVPLAGPDMLRLVAKAVISRRPEAVVALAGGAEEACFLVQSGPEGPDDVGEIGRRIMQRLGAKGGGKGRTFQGRGGRCRSVEDLAP